MSEATENKREVERELDMQTRRLNDLDAALGELQGRLGVVLSPEPPNASGVEKTEEEPDTDLGARLRSLNVQIGNLLSRTNSVLDRCGI